MKLSLHHRGSWLAPALVAWSSVALAVAQERPTEAVLLDTNPLRLELSRASITNLQTNLLTLFVVRHSRIATETGLFDSTNEPALFWTAPSQATLAPDAAQKRLLSNTEAAEAINAAAMRDFQRRFELKLKEPTTTIRPSLYPTQTQRILEEIR